tara:strand:+ start:181 stop:630 length:450 start_codon:yes stop_codon:yes gene_type:complete
VDKIVDGDTIDVTFDLGFSICKSERIRVAGIDTPEKRTRNLEEKELGIHASDWLESQLEGAIAGEEDLVIRTELEGGKGKFGRLLGWLYIGYPRCEDDGDCTCLCHKQVSINEEMVEKGYAWEYDGGTKSKDLEELRIIRREMGTLTTE